MNSNNNNNSNSSYLRRLRAALTRFLNNQNRHRPQSGDSSRAHLQAELAQINQEIEALNQEYVETSDKYYEALDAGNTVEAAQYNTQLQENKRNKKDRKDRKREIEELLDELDDVNDNLQNGFEDLSDTFSDSFSDLQEAIQTLQLGMISDKLSDSVETLYDAVTEASNKLNLGDEGRKELNDSIYKGVQDINDKMGKSILSTNDVADELSSLVDAGMTNPEKLAEISTLLASNNKLLGLDGDTFADYATKFQEEPERIEELYNMLASGKNMDSEYADYAIKAQEDFSDTLNDASQALSQLESKGVDIKSTEAGLFAINSTMQKNSLGDLDLGEMVTDAQAMKPNEFIEKYGAMSQSAYYGLQQGDASALAQYLANAKTQSSTMTEEAFNDAYGGALDYTAMRNTTSSADDILKDFNTYNEQYQGATADDIQNVVDNYQVSWMSRFQNWFTSLPFVQKISSFLGDAGISPMEAVGYVSIGKSLLSMLGIGGGGGGILSGLGSLLSGLGSRAGSFLGGIGSRIGSFLGGLGGSGGGLISSLGSGLARVAPWLGLGAGVIDTGTGIYQGVTGDNAEDKARGWTKAGLVGGSTAIGAGIGSLFGGVGAIPGAAIGAGVGKLADWIGGSWIAKKASGLFGGGNEDASDKVAKANNSKVSEDDLVETASQAQEQETGSISTLDQIYDLLDVWHKEYISGKYTAQSQSTFATFSTDGTVSDTAGSSTALTTSPAGTGMDEAADTSNNNSNKNKNNNPNKNDNSNKNKGGANDSGSPIAPGFEGSHKDGLDYVPHDEYRALLHKGEAVLTADENKVWQTYKDNREDITTSDLSRNYADTFSSVSTNAKSDSIDYVPYDGYITELNKGDRVLTAIDNKKWQLYKTLTNQSLDKVSDSSETLYDIYSRAVSQPRTPLSESKSNYISKLRQNNISLSKYDGSFATGSTSIPSSKYTAKLHKGEGVLSLEDSRVWQSAQSEMNAIQSNAKRSVKLMTKLTSDKIIKAATADASSFVDAFKAMGAVASTGTSDSNLSPGAAGDYLGRYGCAFETGGSSSKANNPGQVSTLAGDSGGTSYGVYQMATNGEAPEFGKWLVKNDPQIGPMFRGKSAGSSGFNQAWKDAYAKYPDQFLKDQVKFFASDGQAYQAWVKGLKSECGMNGEENRGYQEEICSLAAHNGPGGSSRRNMLVGKFWKQGHRGEQLIDDIMEARISQWNSGRNTGKYGSKPALNRWGPNSDERVTMKKLLKQPAIAYEQGTPYVPEDQVALIHEGEMVVPRAHNPLAEGESISIMKEPITEQTDSNSSGNDNSSELEEIIKIMKWGFEFLGKKLKESDNQSVVIKETKKSSVPLTDLSALYNMTQI